MVCVGPELKIYVARILESDWEIHVCPLFGWFTIWNFVSIFFTLLVSILELRDGFNEDSSDPSCCGDCSGIHIAC